MESGTVAAIVAVIGYALSAAHITGVDAQALTGAVNAVITLVAFGASLWSVYIHRQNNAAMKAAGITRN